MSGRAPHRARARRRAARASWESVPGAGRADGGEQAVPRPGRTETALEAEALSAWPDSREGATAAPDGREGCGDAGRGVRLDRGAGPVTPGITSIGLTCEPGEAGGFARVAGAVARGALLSGRGGGAGVLGAGSVSVAGASSGGGSWLHARLAQQRKSPKEPTKLARDIERLSRLGKDRRAVVKTRQYDRSVRMGSGILDFLCWRGGLTGHLNGNAKEAHGSDCQFR